MIQPREQARAGLGTLSKEEFARFTHLNDVYKSKFGFPFIFAVKGATKHMILASFSERVNNSPGRRIRHGPGRRSAASSASASKTGWRHDARHPGPDAELRRDAP